MLYHFHGWPWFSHERGITAGYSKIIIWTWVGLCGFGKSISLPRMRTTHAYKEASHFPCLKTAGRIRPFVIQSKTRSIIHCKSTNPQSQVAHIPIYSWICHPIFSRCYCALGTEQVVSSIPGSVGYILYPMFTRLTFTRVLRGSLGTYMAWYKNRVNKIMLLKFSVRRYNALQYDTIRYQTTFLCIVHAIVPWGFPWNCHCSVYSIVTAATHQTVIWLSKNSSIVYW